MRCQPRGTNGSADEIRTTTRATHRGVFQGIPATNRRVEFTGLVVYRIRDGRIVDSWGEIDFLRLIRQLRAPEQRTTGSQ
jgi:predicted ester cyclase